MTINAQQKCGVTGQSEEETTRFESWLSRKAAERELQSRISGRTHEEVVTIPVVVHIIHDGESIGNGRNISDNQVISQIDVINEDFRRTNADKVNTPSIFESIAADIEIEFVLAKRDPEGLPTNGIQRVDGKRSDWSVADMYGFKRLSYWPAEDYLNMWVIDLEGAFLGYAQFPVSNELNGLFLGSASRLTDGIIIDYKSFGSEDKYPPADLRSRYDKGRTVSHEIGHYLGLRHIWGDGGCNQDDFCADTPPSSSDNINRGSPCTFPGPNTCSLDVPNQPDMFQNYMDFTDDVCMNLFTLDQKERMRTVLDNSPRRVSLKSSKGGIEPVVAANDLGIRKINSPDITNCEGQITPSIQVRNYGTNVITLFKVQLFIDGTMEEEVTKSVTLDALEMLDIDFSTISVTSAESKTLLFKVIETNGVADGNSDNNMKTVTSSTLKVTSDPLFVDFNDFPAGWTINNLDNLSTWQLTNANNGTIGNSALFINHPGDENEGSLDLLQSPVLDLSGVFNAQLTFDVAYPFTSLEVSDGLIVTVSSNCQYPIEQADTIYIKTGKDLSTSNNSWNTPGGSSDWRTESRNLNEYIGPDPIQINFISLNGRFSNLFIDNINLSFEKRADVGIERVISPSVISCQPDQNFQLEVKNVGTLPLGSFNLNYLLDGAVADEIKVTPVDSIAIGQKFIINTPLPELDAGPHVLKVQVDSPNDSDDPSLENNALDLIFYVNTIIDQVPFKETFDLPGTSPWTIVENDGINWSQTTTNNGISIYLNSKDNAFTSQDWLVSPTLDFRFLDRAELTFDLSYSNEADRNERLNVLVSKDCGSTYTEELSLAGMDLETKPIDGFPMTDEDWRTFNINLSDYIGEPEVRIAFVAQGDGGNDIFIDNIQVFVTDPNLNNESELFPNPVVDGQFKLKFDLDRREDVSIIISSMDGQIIDSFEQKNVVNQTFEFSLSGKPSGVYIVKIETESSVYAKRVLHWP